MKRLTVFQTDKGRYSVRPIDWEGIWDKQGRIQESGIHHIAIFEEKEEAEFFVKTKDMEEQGNLLIPPCKPGDTVYIINTLQSGKKIIAEMEADAFFIALCMIEKRFGKTVFLAEQEALKALEGLK